MTDRHRHYAYAHPSGAPVDRLRSEQECFGVVPAVRVVSPLLASHVFARLWNQVRGLLRLGRRPLLLA